MLSNIIKLEDIKNDYLTNISRDYILTDRDTVDIKMFMQYTIELFKIICSQQKDLEDDIWRKEQYYGDTLKTLNGNIKKLEKGMKGGKK